MSDAMQILVVILGFIGTFCTLFVLVIVVNSIREWAIVRTIAKYTGTAPDSWPRFRQASWDYREDRGTKDE